MPNRNYEKGARFEYWIMQQLAERGYESCRTAGSHGKWDIIAWNKHFILFIQAKSGRGADVAERQAMLDSPMPDAPCLRREIWRKEKRKPLRTWLAVKGTFVEQ